MRNKILFIAIFCFSINMVAVSQHTIIEPLETYFKKWQKGESTAAVEEQLLKGNIEEIMSEAERFSADTSADKRYAAFRLTGYLGTKAEAQALRKRAVKQLIFGSNDKDGGIAGNCLKMLTSFDVKDFDTEAIYLLGEMAKKTRTHYEILVKICGWLGITDLNYDLQKAISEKKGSARDRWTMRLAMARMGDEEMIGYCLTRLKNIQVTDDVVYELVPDLVYTRQKALFDYLFTIVESDEKNCSSSNPDSDAKIICAYRVIEQIAPYIEKFPAKTDVSGELVSDDYKKTLKDVRDWIGKNKSSYSILKEKF